MIRYDQGFADWLQESGYRVFDMNEVHRRDHQALSLSPDECR